ncbi:NAD P-binding protein [Gloeophyllum trabeum ATCC 11539]|uniref:NAD P-binding protein n=1 Tax=Gloeophyllum trabeum (strain ATCC 11539 / FP-39264 / Madison 617) TaxID=670483 RepID=S7REY3_GLOTA|nr:NAD P-binding protein [Gloeophyllum trabeum ATCC 11539]EPQ51024.1 NAD P-binding protein [Gloeophyllum trabeum ATCC 11539]
MSSLKLEKLYDLTGRVALVTGGGTGIGLMIAQGLAANGAKVYITGRRKEVLEKVAGEWKASGENGSLVPLAMDATDKESIMYARKEVEEKDGRLHVLVNNAGQTGPRSGFMNDPQAPERKNADTFGLALFANEDIEGWAALYKINTFSIFFVTTAFLGLLDKGSKDRAGHTACVINITSISGYTKLAQNHFCYNSAKAAASHLTKMMATEFALKGVDVRVNGIAPGVYASEMTFTDIDGEEQTNKVGQPLVSIPIRRAGTAQEMAGTAIYLASPAGCYTNGQDIIIDGGYLAVNPSTA